VEKGRAAVCHAHFLVHVGADYSEWQTQLKPHFSVETMISVTLLFVDDQVILAESEDELEMATLQLSDKMATCNLEIS
jgi:hypothetical protein